MIGTDTNLEQKMINDKIFNSLISTSKLEVDR